MAQKLLLMSRRSSRKVKFRKVTLARLAVRDIHCIRLLNVADIVRCEAEANYSRIFYKKREILISHPLKYLEAKLRHLSFFVRVHQHYLVNLNHVEEYVLGENKLILDDGSIAYVSKEFKNNLMSIFNPL